MLQFQHVEDYIEILAGYDPSNASHILFNNSKYKFSLARYDVQIVESMANTTLWSAEALTDRQGELAIKLVLNYRRQFAKFGIDVSPVETPQWRKPLRKIDREQRIWSEGDRILVKFPYNQSWIEDLRQLKESGQGRSKWDADTKVWELGITEYNVNFIVPWGDSKNFTIDARVIDLFEQVLVCESQPYEIKLVKTDLGYEVTNATASLKEYIDQHIGNDIVKLIDHAGILGYTVDADILHDASNDYGQSLEYLGTRHVAHLSPTEPNLWDWLLDYAELTNRYPICIYDPGLTYDLDLSRFSESDIVRFDQNGKTSSSDYDPYNVKVVYAKKLPQNWEFPVPLLVSTHNMMFGGRKLEWLNRAEKIVYWTATIIREN